MLYRIAVLEGDGIGPEVMAEAVKVLKVIEELSDLTFILEYGFVGGAAYQRTKSHLPKETLQVCASSQAILFGSVGGPVEDLHLPKWKNCEIQSILALRKHFNFSMNMRPLRLFPALKDTCLLKKERLDKPIDMLCLRELSEGIYFGKKETQIIEGKRKAIDEMFYHEETIEKIAHKAFQLARLRRKKVTSIDKANVLECSRLWRDVVSSVAKSYPDCTLNHLLVDNATMQVLIKPHEFDVILCANMFGDILSDEISVLTGSLGMLSSASINDQGFGLYEPPGGAAHDIAGEDIANPIGQILSTALMLKISFGLQKEHDLIVKAIEKTLELQYRTADIITSHKTLKKVGTKQMGDTICQFLQQL